VAGYFYVGIEALRPHSFTITVMDVGANNTRIARYLGGELRQLKRHLTVAPNDDSPLAGFYRRLKFALVRDRPDAVVIGAAGPVTAKGVNFTNVDLAIDRAELEAFVTGVLGHSVPVLLVNDAVAGAAGLLTLDENLLVQFNGTPQSLWGAVELLVAIVGTGMGVARLKRHGDLWEVKPTEASHQWTRTALDADVYEHLQGRFQGAVEHEHMASGLGIGNIAQALAAVRSDAALQQWIESIPSHDLARTIAEQAWRIDAHPLLRRTMENFRWELGATVSGFGMNLVPVVLAGAPVSCNLHFLLERHTDIPAGSLQLAIGDRASLHNVAHTIPAYAVKCSIDPARNELNLWGAGVLGVTELLSRAA